MAKFIYSTQPDWLSQYCEIPSSPTEFCGAPVANGLRNFCRRASCRKCVRFASEARARAFVAECAHARRRDRGARWAVVSAPVIHFRRWRGLVHDRIAYRRTVDLARWRDFALLVRWDGRMIAGVAHLPVLGTLDLIDLFAGDDDAVGIQALAGEPETTAGEVLASAPAHDLGVSLKGVFFTVRPARARQAAEPRRRTAWDEPMPILF